MDKEAYLRLLSVIQYIDEGLHGLRHSGNPRASEAASVIHDILSQLRRDLDAEAQEQIFHALARINFRDERYRVLNVIDGDTLVVEPPGELREWMRDVHVRLYGVDTPERNTELGPKYTAVLKHLCGMGNDFVGIVWERERSGTVYAGFPTTSFERGVGNLFVDFDDKHVLYINAVLAAMPEVAIERGGKALIRGARHIPRLSLENLPVPLHDHWQMYWSGRQLSHILTSLSGFDLESGVDIRRFIERLYPRSPWFLPRTVLHEHASELERGDLLISPSLVATRCEECKEIRNWLNSEWLKLITQERATTFDAALIFAYAYTHAKDEPAG